jgi:hypothetical protein
MRISPEHFASAYRQGCAFYEEKVGRAEARAALVAEGMNEASADFSIGNLRQMLNGAEYNRAMSIAQTRFFLTSIHRDYRTHGLANAVSALEKHIPYLRKTNGSRLPGLTAVLDEFQAKLLQERPIPTDSSALDDLTDGQLGSKTPDRARRVTEVFKRDPRVRAFVVRRAAGCCEYCRGPGFVMRDGKHYVETHHIIALAQQGPDSPENVIALCANHHRQAHFGSDADVLERKFLEILKK